MLRGLVFQHHTLVSCLHLPALVDHELEGIIRRLRRHISGLTPVYHRASKNV